MSACCSTTRSTLLERYNAPDTLKCQHTVQAHRRALPATPTWAASSAPIVTDNFGWHDTVCGNTTKASTARKWGETSYQINRNDWYQNGHDSFLIEAAKHGLGRRDLPANVNWFSKVVVADDGALSLDQAPPRRARRSSCASRWTLWSCSTPARIRSSRRSRLSTQARAL